jgi:hypothetical protein
VLGFGNQNVSTYTWLQFRAAQRPANASNPGAPENALNQLDTFKDFQVRIKDAASNTRWWQS